jgi:hypothetical protein
LAKKSAISSFAFLVDDQKIEIAVSPRYVAVEADSESQDDFPWHAAIVNRPFTYRQRRAPK